MFYSRWYWRYAAHFTPVVPPFTLRRGQVLPVFRPFVVGGMVLILLLLVRLHSGQGKCCPLSAFGVGVMLPILLLLAPPL